ncbi:aminoimidazole riboside kinase [Aquibacillus rhizosphaerae]|uniref:Aminoimidazole riboside kinase n=1 Tax=Aquibacillus rhizosphaerae TaxID=3051431 RepID=A0ABT7LBB5_9BACI|nr:aminoimidazole riboside kinase [Aquibacillus sp. LR5S19]MDL4843146.1 aminoimidazole riboside kinase [Aquibacillus sp. LR5S19]
MKNGVISLGEALIDFIPTDETNNYFYKSPGGAPANVAVGLARLGLKSSFVGKVGNDVLGVFLKETLHNFGVDTKSMFVTEDVRTGVVFVTNDQNGDRSFEFYINPSADRFLEDEEIDKKIFLNNKLLHIGSISLIDNPIKTATIKAVDEAKTNGMIVSYDPNLRLSLWPNEEVAHETIISMIPKADVLKISEEELNFITREEDVQKGLKKIREYNVPLIFVTVGSKGCWVITNQGSSKIDAMKVKTIDTTGAGDAFMSSVLYCLHERDSDVYSITLKEAEEIARFSSVAGGLAASVKGAMSALPDLTTVEKNLHNITSLHQGVTYNE